nr:MFS transporter [Pseudactinotalea sp. HY160]
MHVFDSTATVLDVQSTPRRARIATIVAFATNGALPATLLARYAEVKTALSLDAAAFGLVVVGFTLGAAASFHLPGVILRRLGIRRTAALGTAWIALALLAAAAGVAHGSVWIFLGGLALAGFGDAVVDVAQNAQGLLVQQAYRRSLLSSMHAGWSVGAALGGIAGTVAASLGVPLPVHLAAWGAAAVVAMGVSARSFLPEPAAAPPGRQPTGPAEPAMPADPIESTAHARPARIDARALRLLAPLALVALAGFAVEDVGNNWSAVLLATERGVPTAAAGIGLSVLLVAQFAGRLLGDRFIDRAGRRAALVTSLSAVAAGLVAAAWAPWAPATIAGFALAGAGCAITVPLAFAGADAVPGLRPHAGVTLVSWTMRAGAVGLSPAIGQVATLVSLPAAISAVALLAVAALLLHARGARAPHADRVRGVS